MDSIIEPTRLPERVGEQVTIGGIDITESCKEVTGFIEFVIIFGTGDSGIIGMKFQVAFPVDIMVEIEDER